MTMAQKLQHQTDPKRGGIIEKRKDLCDRQLRAVVRIDNGGQRETASATLGRHIDRANTKRVIVERGTVNDTRRCNAHKSVGG